MEFDTCSQLSSTRSPINSSLTECCNLSSHDEPLTLASQIACSTAHCFVLHPSRSNDWSMKPSLPLSSVRCSPRRCAKPIRSHVILPSSNHVFLSYVPIPGLSPRRCCVLA